MSPIPSMFALTLNNVHIGNSGDSDDTALIRIGTADLHTSTFIAGIFGAQVLGRGMPVEVNNDGQLFALSCHPRLAATETSIDRLHEPGDRLGRIEPSPEQLEDAGLSHVAPYKHVVWARESAPAPMPRASVSLGGAGPNRQGALTLGADQQARQKVAPVGGAAFSKLSRSVIAGPDTGSSGSDTGPQVLVNDAKVRPIGHHVLGFGPGHPASLPGAWEPHPP